MPAGTSSGLATGLERDGVNQTTQQLLGQLLDAGRIMLTLPATVDRSAVAGVSLLFRR
jgi:hypothetical protein